jgi:hypothetical protein
MMALNVEHLVGPMLPKRHTDLLRNITKPGCISKTFPDSPAFFVSIIVEFPVYYAIHSRLLKRRALFAPSLEESIDAKREPN